MFTLTRLYCIDKAIERASKQQNILLGAEILDLKAKFRKLLNFPINNNLSKSLRQERMKDAFQLHKIIYLASKILTEICKASLNRANCI